MKKMLAGIVFLLASLPCFAQFIGYTSPQTVQTKLASGTACTGSPQTFITGTTPGFSNIGQTQHVVTSSSSTAQTFTMELDGIDVTGTVFRMSDVQVGSAPGIGTAAVPSVLSGSGYYAQLQVVVTCAPVSATFSVSYEGFSSAPNPVSGASALSSSNKILFSGAPANASQNLVFQTPYGNSGGVILFTFQTTSETGASISFSCLSAKADIINNVQFPLANNTNQQVFAVPSGACPIVAIGYFTGGATTATMLAEYVFAQPGAASPSPPGFFYKNIATNASTQLKSAAGFLHAITINNIGTTETLTIFDNTSCAGTTIGTTGALTAQQTLIFDVNYYTGLCITSAGTTTGNWTVSYQ